MLLETLAILAGLVGLIFGADRFVWGASEAASILGMPPLLIGMIIVGFGTSAPEMVTSLMAALDGAPQLAFGNAYGSNIANIGLILGLTALISPIAVQSRILKVELPVLCGITVLSVALLWDLHIGHFDAIVLLGVFALLIGGSILASVRSPEDALASDVETETEARESSLGRSIVWLVAGLVLLVVCSRGLVWGATSIASELGVSDLVIGLTIVAVGTSLPELASSVVAALKGQHDLALGNILGSNLFNTLAVVGIASAIFPTEVDPEILTRDMAVMGALTLVLFVMGSGFGRQGQISRIEGGFLVVTYVSYTLYLILGS